MTTRLGSSPPLRDKPGVRISAMTGRGSDGFNETWRVTSRTRLGCRLRSCFSNSRENRPSHLYPGAVFIGSEKALLKQFVLARRHQTARIVVSEFVLYSQRLFIKHFIG